MSFRRSVRVTGPFLSHLIGLPAPRAFDVLRINPASTAEDLLACTGEQSTDCKWMKKVQMAVFDNAPSKGSGGVKRGGAVAPRVQALYSGSARWTKTAGFDDSKAPFVVVQRVNAKR